MLPIGVEKHPADCPQRNQSSRKEN
jgi:hypothetical protein